MYSPMYVGQHWLMIDKYILRVLSFNPMDDVCLPCKLRGKSWSWESLYSASLTTAWVSEPELWRLPKSCSSYSPLQSETKALHLTLSMALDKGWHGFFTDTNCLVLVKSKIGYLDPPWEISSLVSSLNLAQWVHQVTVWMSQVNRYLIYQHGVYDRSDICKSKHLID